MSRVSLTRSVLNSCICITILLKSVYYEDQQSL